MTKSGLEKNRSILVVLLLLFVEPVFAQGLPQTDIWLAAFHNGLPGEPVKVNLTGGYNNQPHFSNDGAVIYYTREMPGADGSSQTDIAALSLTTMTTTMVTHTSESEYSPTPIPGRNALSVIQVEADQKQRLWAINLDHSTLELLLPEAEPVGYHVWLNKHEVAMFVLGASATLQLAAVGTNDQQELADNIGRSLRRHPHNGDILYVDKNPVPWQIAAYQPASKSIRSVMPLFPASEDFTIDGQGRFWTGNGSRLYRRRPGDDRWELMADFSAAGIHNISRLAINPANDQIALVTEHQPEN